MATTATDNDATAAEAGITGDKISAAADVEDFGEPKYIFNQKLQKSLIQYSSLLYENTVFTFRKKALKRLKNQQVNEYWICIDCEKMVRLFKEDDEAKAYPCCTIIIANQRFCNDPDSGHHPKCYGRTFIAANAHQLDREARDECRQGRKRPMEAHSHMNEELSKRFAAEPDIAVQIQSSLPNFQSARSGLKRWFRRSKGQEADHNRTRSGKPYCRKIKPKDDTIDALFQACLSAKLNAYAPYSNFRVGAALLCYDDTIYTGCNVENAAYNLGICAERTAICKAVSEGKLKFKAIAIAGDSPETFPCGGCRQFMIEFGDFSVYMVSSEDGGVRQTTTKRLLPQAFTVKNLNQKKPVAIEHEQVEQQEKCEDFVEQETI